MTFGPQLERLLAVAASPRLFALGGRRDADGPPPSALHLVPRGKGKPRSLALDAPILALAFGDDELVLAGCGDGRLRAIVVGDGEPMVRAELDLGAAVRAVLIVDAGSALATTADGALHRLTLEVRDARPTLTARGRVAVAERGLDAIAVEGGVIVVGGVDGAWVVDGDRARPLAVGGDGGVRALVGLGDGRIVAGCGDGAVRTAYVVGEAEAADRAGANAHAGAVRALALGPLLVDGAGRELARRLWSLGEDGALKSWPLDSNRKPRTLELGAGPGTALAIAVGAVKGVDGSTAQVIAVTAARKLVVQTLGADGEPVGNPAVTAGELERLAADLEDHKPKSQGVRAAAVITLGALPEDEARLSLERALARDPAPEVKIAAAQVLAQGGRRRARPALRAALGDGNAKARAAAFAALIALEAAEPLAAIRAGLAARAEDVRVLALDALAAQPPGTLTAALAADGFTDAVPAVRDRAFAVARALGAADPRWAVRTALARGPADLRARALFTLGLVDRADDAAARALVAAALDDDSPEVRWAAYAVALCARPRLTGRLRAIDATLAANLIDAAARVGVAEAALPAATTEAAPLDDDERAPLFQAMASRQPETALRGARGLVYLGDPRALGALLGLSRDPDAGVRRAAVDALAVAARTIADDDRALARLGWLLDDADPQVRGAAIAALIERTAGAADAELDLAELALRASQADVRTRALALLIKHGPAGPVAARADALLGDALDDEAPAVRTEAYKTVWAWHAATPLVPLARAARSRHADLRGQVVAELARRRAATPAPARDAALDAALVALVRDPVAEVGHAAYAALVGDGADGKPGPGRARADVHLAAMASPRASVRAAGAAGARHAPGAQVRPRLVELVKDDQPAVHTAAIESLDHVAPTDAEGFALAFASIFYALQVRAGELCGTRRDRRAVAPMQRLLAIPRTDVDRPSDELRRRAARALADVGDAGAVPFLSGLLDDDDAIVREMAGRGLATACGPAEQQALLDALGHADLPVRSWAAEGLARLGDLRALPVLAGTQRHDHRPLRLGAIVGLTALGADGARGLRQALEDPDREVAELAFAVIVARDVALAAADLGPDLLLDALASPGAELRFAAARLIEARAAGAPLLDVATELVGPRKPVATAGAAAADTRDWPPEARRAALLRVVVDNLASDASARRYAAAQVLALRPQPLAYWREAQRLSGPAQTTAPATNYSSETRTPRTGGWIRRLVVGRAAAALDAAPAPTELERLALILRCAGGPEPTPVPPRPAAGGLDPATAARLVFGVYAGLVRQGPAPGAADETQRVRRDAVARIAALAADGAVGKDAALPALEHALADGHNLVRAAAMTAVRAQYPAGALAPLAAALRSAADVGKAALDELIGLASAGDADAAALVHAALDADDAAVRAHALLRLARLYPAGSVAPLLAGARSRFADVRAAAVAELVERSDAGDAGDAGPVAEALATALGSDDAELRLGAARGLALRGDPRAIDALAALLRDGDRADDARAALVEAAGRAPTVAGAAASALAARLLDDPDRTADVDALVTALGEVGHEAAAPALLELLAGAVPEGQPDRWASVRSDALYALLQIARDPALRPARLPDGRTRDRYREPALLGWLAEAARATDPAIRAAVARTLGDVDDRGAEEQLERLLADRDAEVRTRACEALALRVAAVPTATLAPLEAALRGGRRELVLPAGEGLARRGRPEAFFALLLVLKAGEPPERERAALALGQLGDRRALEHLLPILDAGPDAPQDQALAPVVIESLGALVAALAARADADADELAALRERIERTATGGLGPARLRALAALRRIGDGRSRALLERVLLDRELGDAERVAAATELGALGDAASEAAFGVALAGDNGAVRGAALLAALAVFAADRTRAYMLALPSAWADVSGPAAAYLARHGEPATIVAHLGALGDDIRRGLREGLVRRAAFPERAIADALAADDVRARIEAAWLAGAAGAATLAPAVVAAVDRAAAGWRAARTVELARGAAGRLAVTRAAEAWQAALWAAQRVGADVRPQAIAAAGDAAAPPDVRAAAASWLAAHAAAALRGLVFDEDRAVRTRAARAAAASGDAEAARTAAANVDLSATGPLVAAGLGLTGGTEALLAGADARGAAIAVAIATRREAELIAVARRRGEDAARLAAIAALGRLGGDGARAALEAIVADAGEAQAVKRAAWKALARLRRNAARVWADGVDRARPGERGAVASAASDEESDSDDDSGDDDDDDDDDGDDDGDDHDDDDDGDDDDDSGDDDSGDSDDDDGDDDDDDDDEDDDE